MSYPLNDSGEWGEKVKNLFLTFFDERAAGSFATSGEFYDQRRGFIGLVISAGVEPALSGWKPDVLTVILRDQDRPYNSIRFYCFSQA